MKKKCILTGLMCSLFLGSMLIPGTSTGVEAEAQEQTETDLKITLYKKIMPDKLPGETVSDETNNTTNDTTNNTTNDPSNDRSENTADSSLTIAGKGTSSLDQGKGENHFLKTSFLPETGAVKNNWLLCGGIGLIMSIFLFYICKPKRRKEKEE
ncbi:hypothetical protein [Enterococcus hirae]|uniref:hypothetical protein n=1 Tax=Enterococcus hirae TaxID=1354 RepID=UPI000B53C941|nr:hypothetical protein [Enterococcus hirae]OWW61076.1 hypothetical protein F523_01695 [Enterococcus hirae 78-09-C1]OWW71367.1 hypothetical protein C655_00385 [Enterococcus hirae 57-09-G6]